MFNNIKMGQICGRNMAADWDALMESHYDEGDIDGAQLDVLLYISDREKNNIMDYLQGRTTRWALRRKIYYDDEILKLQNKILHATAGNLLLLCDMLDLMYVFTNKHNYTDDDKLSFELLDKHYPERFNNTANITMDKICSIWPRINGVFAKYSVEDELFMVRDYTSLPDVIYTIESLSNCLGY